MRNVFVTGVSSGIGHAMCAELLARGDAVYGVSRRTPDDLVEHEKFHFASIDLTAGDAAEKIGELLSGVPHLHLAILNAGVISSFGDMAETPLDELRHVMDVNLWGNKTVIDAVFRDERTIEQLVTISSGASVNGHRGWNGYSISKAALNMLTMLYAREQPQTHFCALAPGIIDTYMQQQVADAPEDERFPALARLRSKRGTDEMPGPEEAASRLLSVIDRLPDVVESGDFADVRKPPLA